LDTSAVMADTGAALRLFDRALAHSRLSNKHRAEIEWQRSVELEEFTESDLLRESAWVVLCSGFRESIVRQIFDHISLCFCDWESADAIVSSAALCVTTARASFRNTAKLNALVEIAAAMQKGGFNEFKACVLREPIASLQMLPFIGPVTSWHLAKNLGMDVAKPDRHLVRIASALGFKSAHEVCLAISRSVGEPLKVVDVVLWRYLADNHLSKRAKHIEDMLSL
jgi:hypothetical protein